MTTVLVSGAVANKHANGGATWTRLSWVLGLQRLGCTVAFVEQLDPAHCIDDAGAPADFWGSANLDYFRRVMDAFGLADRSALVHGSGPESFGLTIPELCDFAGEADLLVNISGHFEVGPIVSRILRKAFVDLDPGYTQCWWESDALRAGLAGHDLFFTIGENIGTPESPIPTGGIQWRPIRQPVLLEQWPVIQSSVGDPFTTVASWRGPYGPVQCAGRRYGLKVHEFRKFVELPERVTSAFELALDIHPDDAADRNLLLQHGWRLADPGAVAGDPNAFRTYVQSSGAEFSVAQGIYVESNSGWFSDRTTRYLATGRPALVQDTGFSRRYPVGEGLLAFRTMDDAIQNVERIVRDYPGQCRAARCMAETYFDSDVVLADLLNQVELAC
jgi:hypothetical protein